MRQLSRAAAAIALVVVVQGFLVGAASAAPDVQVGDKLNFDNGLGANGGGEFTANVVSGAYTGSSFKTYCIERTQSLNFSADFTIGAINTVGLVKETAYLFTSFNAGNLAGYLGDAASQTALQLAIWHFQNQLNPGGGHTDLTAVFAANALAQQFKNDAIANATGLGQVRILKMVWPNGENAQDVLIVPEPASVLAWSLIGGCFVAGHRLRRGKWSLR